MPIYAVPIVTTSGAPRSRAQFSSIPVRNKRKRAASPTPSLSDDDDDAQSQHSRSKAAASTNPLSLTPAEVVQYRLAGLELDEQIPKAKAKNWPHSGLATEPTHIRRRDFAVEFKGKGKEVINTNDNDDEGLRSGEDSDRRMAEMSEERAKDQPPPGLRLQHLEVLTAILQRCLLDGDIPRATRAWSMLVRAQVGGHAMDLRASGYWAIGAELLSRSGEKLPAKNPRPRDNVDSDEDEQDGQVPPQEIEPNSDPTRYGTAAGLERAKDYYEKLILQHPYNRQWKDNVSALDFWPAMVGCEIYSIQHEQKACLRMVTLDKELEDEDENALSSPSVTEPETDEGHEDDDSYAIEHRRKAGSRGGREERRWQEREKIRKTALVAYEKLAARLDDLLTTLPYSDSHTMLRLRGMLALCIGDLMVPVRPPGSIEEEETEEHPARRTRSDLRGKNTEGRLLLRQRLAEHKRAKSKQREQHIRAGKLFERIKMAGGRKEGVADSLPREEDAEDD